MTGYKAPLRDMHFVLFELLNVQDMLAKMPNFEEATPDLITQILEEAAKFAEQVLAPINRSGDEEACRLENGAVVTPKGFKEAYTAYREAGWMALSGDPKHGGQGLPQLLEICVNEMSASANLAWAIYTTLTQGAYAAIRAHGDAAMQTLYLPKLLDGSWSGTMCLTEPQCGTDLGLVRTKAVPQANGTYAVTGTKIFISSGEHDLTENIVHLVLARLPDAPPGIKGTSMFLVPKFLPNEDGAVGERNPVHCGAIEHKMGIRANATAVLNFEGATGYLIGQPHQGMRHMFTMMNAARLAVGLQGLALGEVSFQHALAYAKERLQMRALSGPKFPDLSADPIIVHPDVRRMLLTQKAYNEAGRALIAWLALQLDIEAAHPDPNTRAAAADIVALLIPVAKAFLTDNGFVVCNLGLQVFGGHGYVRESGMEQFVRDARIAQIYEGANGIQALDLIGRKVLEDRGVKLQRFTKIIHEFVTANRDDKPMQAFVGPLAALLQDTGDITAWIGARAAKNPDEAGAAAADYLRLIGFLTFAYLWARTAKLALAKLDGEESAFYQAKLATARFFYARLLPETAALLATIKSGAAVMLDLDTESFAF